MSLHGNHMTLACFHGPNFRSKSWALFHLEEPNIAFWTEAQKIWEDGKLTHFKLLLFSSSDVIIHSRVTFLSHLLSVFSYNISEVHSICYHVPDMSRSSLPMSQFL